MTVIRLKTSFIEILLYFWHIPKNNVILGSLRFRSLNGLRGERFDPLFCEGKGSKRTIECNPCDRIMQDGTFVPWVHILGPKPRSKLPTVWAPQALQVAAPPPPSARVELSDETPKPTVATVSNDLHSFHTSLAQVLSEVREGMRLNNVGWWWVDLDL